jgi:hypothetical protein
LLIKTPQRRAIRRQAIHAKSNDAVANNHEAHITSNGPTNKQSDDERSNAESNYTIANDREAHITPDGPAEWWWLQ